MVRDKSCSCIFNYHSNTLPDRPDGYVGGIMEVKNKKVLVFGLGISGIGAGKILEAHGADVVLYDGNQKLTEEKVRKQLGEDSNARIVIGEFPEEILENLDMTVLSPGVPTDLPVIEKMRKQGVTVIGEVELAYQYGKGDVLAITGTNGKDNNYNTSWRDYEELPG